MTGDYIQVFDTTSFAQVGAFSLPAISSNGNGDSITSMATDNTGSYLFIGQNTQYANKDGSPYYVGKVVVVGTGVGTLKPLLPVAALAAPARGIIVGSGQSGAFTLTLSSAPSTNIVVAYAVKGSAANGRDYVMLKGKVKVKAGKMSKAITITPRGNLGGVPVKTVVLKLLPGDGYAVGTTGKVKVKLIVLPTHG